MYALGTQWVYADRDEEKKRACAKAEITLIEVPYWWDRTKESLAATIHKARSDLILNPPGVDPIPLAKDAMSNGMLSHGYSWDGFQDVTGW